MTTIEEVIEQKRRVILDSLKKSIEYDVQSATERVDRELDTLKETLQASSKLFPSVSKLLDLIDKNLIAVKTIETQFPAYEYLNVQSIYNGKLYFQVGPIQYKKVKVTVIVEPIEDEEKHKEEKNEQRKRH